MEVRTKLIAANQYSKIPFRSPPPHFPWFIDLLKNSWRILRTKKGAKISKKLEKIKNIYESKIGKEK